MSKSFAQFTKLVIGSVRGEARPHAKHRFRTGPLEAFEERITPTITAFPGQTPFVPPGQVVPYQNAANFTASFSTDGNKTVTGTVTNNTNADHYLTFTIYRAPGGGGNPSSNAYDNLVSQKLVYSETLLVEAGQTLTFTPVDVSTLHLTQQGKFQCDFFDAGDDPNGYAPDKPFENTLGDRLVSGELFKFDRKSG